MRRSGGDATVMSDEAIALACASGDPAAIGELFQRFRRPVARYIHRLVGGGPDVEDLVQATFMELARGRSNYDVDRARVSTWLFGIATNIVRHHRRAAGRRSSLRTAFARLIPSPSADPSHLADTRRQLERAHSALMELPEDQREAFVLCELEGLSAKDAGVVLGATETAVWKRVSKARRTVRDKVSRETST